MLMCSSAVNCYGIVPHELAFQGVKVFTVSLNRGRLSQAHEWPFACQMCAGSVAQLQARGPAASTAADVQQALGRAVRSGVPARLLHVFSQCAVAPWL